MSYDLVAGEIDVGILVKVRPSWRQSYTVHKVPPILVWVLPHVPKNQTSNCTSDVTTGFGCGKNGKALKGQSGG